MTPEQREALALVLGHYGSDPRVRPLHDLLNEDGRLHRLVQAAEAVVSEGEDCVDDFKVPSHLIAALALSLDEIGETLEAEDGR